MGVLEKLEATVNNWVNHKGLPKMPEAARTGLAKSLWWLALAFGILELLMLVQLWRLGHYFNAIDRAADFVNSYYGYSVATTSLNLFFYLAIVVAAIEALLLLLASPALKAHKKTGWNLLFYVLILNAVYAVVRAFSSVGGGVGALFWAALATAVGAYLLFQVRDYFITPGRTTAKK